MTSGTYCGCSPSNAAWTLTVAMLKRWPRVWNGYSPLPAQSGWLAKVEYPKI